MGQSEKELKPGYFNEKPLLKGISAIKKTMGIQDSCIQTNEVAVRYLEEQSEQVENVSDFIKKLCKTYSISIGINDFKYFQSVQYKSYILQTYNLIEPLFKGLNKEVRYYHNIKDWKTKDGDKNLDPFNQLLENLDVDARKLIKSFPEYYLLNYYRLVRNSIVHLQEDPEEHKKTSKYFEDNLTDKLDFFHENYDLKAPNMPNGISFHDFMLYTRAIKYFSNILNDICFPNINSLIIAAKGDENLQIALLQSRNLNYKGVLLKRINVLRSYFHYHFNISHKKLRDDFCKAYLDEEGTDYSGFLNKEW